MELILFACNNKHTVDYEIGFIEEVSLQKAKHSYSQKRQEDLRKKDLSPLKITCRVKRFQEFIGQHFHKRAPYSLW